MYLEKILSHKQLEVAARKEQQPLESLIVQLEQAAPVRDFKARITGDSIKLIAEVKKASPSKGLLCPDFNPEALATCYESAGAAAISVLTDERFFQGSLAYLKTIKAVTKQTAVLRKDFIIDRYQLVEARVYGADAVLLIVAALTTLELKQFIQATKDLGMTPLVEVHDSAELAMALEAGAEVIGVNNRNLTDFSVSLTTTDHLVQLMPPGVVSVSESGIKTFADISHLAEIGVNAVLVGESIVTASDPGMKIQELMGLVS